uniref:Uncharacterized protein n=1 Tax=Rhizophora mucronata TaxID=61149 RepID=A0A2P2PAW2_RHIMU
MFDLQMFLFFLGLIFLDVPITITHEVGHLSCHLLHAV